jgi:hypothetical protein
MVSSTEIDQTKAHSSDADADGNNLKHFMLLPARINANRWPIHRTTPIDRFGGSRVFKTIISTMATQYNSEPKPNWSNCERLLPANGRQWSRESARL